VHDGVDTVDRALARLAIAEVAKDDLRAALAQRLGSARSAWRARMRTARPCCSRRGTNRLPTRPVAPVTSVVMSSNVDTGTSHRSHDVQARIRRPTIDAQAGTDRTSLA
jgi:hypothetical protein